MSYARFGADGSDVYVFTSSLGLECCGCLLQNVKYVEDKGQLLGWYLEPVGEIIRTVFDSNELMIHHLNTHLGQGHHVPGYVFERLRDPEDVRNNKEIWNDYRKRDEDTGD